MQPDFVEEISWRMLVVAASMTQSTSSQREALVFYDTCMLRYSNRSLYGLTEDSPPFYLVSPRNIASSEVEGFFEELWKLIQRLSSEAAAGGSLRKFAVNSTTTSDFRTIYAQAQCTPDLSEQDCTDCLVGAYGDITTYCYGKDGARILKPSCNIRYKPASFLDPANVAPLPSSPPISPPSPSTNTTNSEGTEGADESRSAKSLQFDFGTIRVATDDFSEANKLGQGGFGSVYRIPLLARLVCYLTKHKQHPHGIQPLLASCSLMFKLCYGIRKSQIRLREAIFPALPTCPHK
ncbi:putative Gnk2-like domain, protein kinase [Rosa chinensis]|uniref:Putative Gnk2-like domain, protein kinase n=1 Tax=Rosa chinensis TaxID=74649 RepID=A0A2P6RQV1_ROSCH|nr:putative Gnk2-like domain, protein kinase [Rosa chinensis]